MENDEKVPAGRRLNWMEHAMIKGLFRHVFVFLVYTLVAAVVLNIFMSRWGFRDNNPRFGFEQVINFKAHRPFVYRVFMPGLIKAVSYVTPDSIKEKILSAPVALDADTPYPFTQMQEMKKRYKLKNGYEFEKVVAYLLLFLCLVLLLYSLRYLTRAVYDPPGAALDFAPALALLFLPAAYLRGGYLYDFPELLFLVLAVVFLVKSAYWLYYPVLILAVLNKESAILIFFFLAALKYKDLKASKMLMHLALHLAVGVPIILYTRHLFAGNPGVNMAPSFFDNLKFYLNGSNYFFFYPVFSIYIPFPKGINIINILLILFLVLFRWKRKPPEARRLFVVSLIVNLPLFLLFCWRDEIRNLSMVFPALYLLGFHTLYSLYGEKARNPAIGEP